MPLALPFSTCAPKASVLPSPLSVSREPNQSSFPGFEDLMKACSVQTVPLRTKTYTAPLELSIGWSLSHTTGVGGKTPGVMQSSSAAPPAIVFPSWLIAIEYPKESPVSALEALRYDCWAHVPPVRVKT